MVDICTGSILTLRNSVLIMVVLQLLKRLLLMLLQVVMVDPDCNLFAVQGKVEGFFLLTPWVLRAPMESLQKP